jgi:hypothetical protein
MSDGSHGVFVGKLAMFMSCGCVLLGVFVLAHVVEMGRLKVMMRGGLVVSGRQMVRFTRRVLRQLCHYLRLLAGTIKFMCS